MKKLLYAFSIMLVVACGSDDPVTPPPTVNTEFVLNATGTVAEKSPEEAKKIIYGKWDLSEGQRLTANSCAFNFIEFTDDYYIMGFSVNQEIEAVFGTYELNTNADGFVTSVDLHYEMSDTPVATLTNIIVTETDEVLYATFTIVLNIPENSEYTICNNLEGDYTANKEDPMEESNTSGAGSNHALLISTWTFVSRTVNGVDDSYDIYQSPCGYYDYDENCTPATDVHLTFSTYGTYSFVYSGSSSGTRVYTNTWTWTNDTQTSFQVGDETGDIVGIASLTDTQVVFTENDVDDIDPGNVNYYEIIYTFTKN